MLIFIVANTTIQFKSFEVKSFAHEQVTLKSLEISCDDYKLCIHLSVSIKLCKIYITQCYQLRIPIHMCIHTFTIP